jgi:hypothetical protein
MRLQDRESLLFALLANCLPGFAIHKCTAELRHIELDLTRLAECCCVSDKKAMRRAEGYMCATACSLTYI